jgi:hypothetical protein
VTSAGVGPVCSLFITRTKHGMDNIKIVFYNISVFQCYVNLLNFSIFNVFPCSTKPFCARTLYQLQTLRGAQWPNAQCESMTNQKGCVRNRSCYTLWYEHIIMTCVCNFTFVTSSTKEKRHSFAALRPKKRTILLLRYLYHNTTQNISTWLDPKDDHQGTNQRNTALT